MKYYSEKLKKVFDTPEALEQEEKDLLSTDINSVDDLEDIDSEKNLNDSFKDQKETIKPASRKQLAADVEAAEAKLKDEYANYELAKQQVEELSKKYLEEVDAILEPAKTAVKKAEKDRYEALRKFNDSFGPYQVMYTGDRAAQEMLRAINDINTIQRKVFRNLFW